MNINQLRYFQAVCQLKYIVKAAEVLHVSQPAISATIKTLESELGIDLFYRINKRLLLTPEGEFVLGKVNIILENIDNLALETKNLSMQKTASIKMGVSTVDASVFSKIYMAAKTAYPEIRIESCEQSYQLAPQMVKEHITDYSLMIINEPLPRDPELHYQFITALELCYCVNKNHHLAKEPFVSFDMIKTEPIAEFKEGSYHEKLVQEMFHKHDATPNIVFRSDIMFVLDDFARKSGAGVFGIRDLFESDKEIIAISLEEPLKINIGLIWSKDRKKESPIPNFPEFVAGLYLA